MQCFLMSVNGDAVAVQNSQLRLKQIEKLLWSPLALQAN